MEILAQGRESVKSQVAYRVVYICASLLHLVIESRDLSQGEKKITVVAN